MSILPNQWPLLRFSEVCEINPRQEIASEGDVTFVPMAAVDEHMGEIARPEVRDLSDVRRGFTPFMENDVLFAKITPCMQNGKAAVARNLVNGLGFGSTEFHVLRASPIVLPDWLFHFVRRPDFRRAAEAAFVGTAGQQRVPTDFLAYSKIPVPPLSEQRRIVEILNEARDIRRLRQQADDLTTQLIPAIFNEMFGDPLLNPKGWPTAPLSHSYKIIPNYGTMTPAEDFEDGILCIRVGDIQDNQLNLAGASRVPRDSVDSKRHLVEVGDIVLVRAIGSLDHLGKSAVITHEENGVAFDSHLMRVRFDQTKLLPDFVHSLFLTPGGRRLFLKNTRQSAVQVNINTDEYGRIRIPMPPPELQEAFVSRVAEIRMLWRQQEEARSLESKTYQSLLAHAFSGSLTANWRAENRDLLAQETADRDQWLRENGVKLTIPDQRNHDRLDQNDGRLSELNREQRKLLAQIQNLDPNENGGTFTLSSLASKLDEPLDSLPVDTIRRHLDVLAARGLIKAISRRAGAGGSVNVAFGNLYRQPLKEDQIVGTADEPDFQKLPELDRLSRQGLAISAIAGNSRNISQMIKGGAWEDHTHAPDVEE